MRYQRAQFTYIRKIATQWLIEAALTSSEKKLQEAYANVNKLFNENKSVIIDYLRNVYGQINTDIPFDLSLAGRNTHHNEMYDYNLAYAGETTYTYTEWCTEENRNIFFIRELYVANAMRGCLKKATDVALSEKDRKKYMSAAYFLMEQSVPCDSAHKEPQKIFSVEYNRESLIQEKIPEIQGQISETPRFAAE